MHKQMGVAEFEARLLAYQDTPTSIHTFHMPDSEGSLEQVTLDDVLTRFWRYVHSMANGFTVEINSLDRQFNIWRRTQYDLP